MKSPADNNGRTGIFKISVAASSVQENVHGRARHEPTASEQRIHCFCRASSQFPAAFYPLQSTFVYYLSFTWKIVFPSHRQKNIIYVCVACVNVKVFGAVSFVSYTRMPMHV